MKVPQQQKKYMKPFNSSLIPREDSVQEEFQKTLDRYFLEYPNRRFNISVFNLESQNLDDSLMETPYNFLMCLNWDKINLRGYEIIRLSSWLHRYEKV